MLSQILVLFSAFGLFYASGTQVTEENCEVCVKFLSKFINTLEENVKSSTSKIEDEFRKFCEEAKLHKDNRFCYYVGGLKESATGMLGEISKPVSWSMPADKICQKLRKMDTQICDLKYDKKIDLAKVDVNKLKVNDLKKILSDWGETCRGCSEKSDYVRMVKELLPKYAPEAVQDGKEL